MDKHAFLTEYNFTEEDLLAAEVTWEELTLIANAYRKLEGTMRELGKSFIDEYLYDIETAGIHSYRYRTKNVWHLLEKVVRKKKENPEKFGQLDHCSCASSSLRNIPSPEQGASTATASNHSST